MIETVTNRAWPADTEPSARYPLYTRGNVGEVFPGVMSVITGTLIGNQVNLASYDLFREMGFLLERDLEPVPAATGVFCGYLYGNASLFRLMGLRAPGMKVTDADDQVSGGIEGMPPYVRRKGDRSTVATLRLGRYLLGVMRRPDLAPLDAARADAQRWVALMPAIETATDDELLAYVNEYPDRIRASMNRLLRYSMLAGGPRALAERVLERSGAPVGLLNRLVSGIDDVDSARIAQRQWDLARIVAADAALTARFDDGLDGLLPDLEGTALAEPLAQFLAEYGHRCNDEYELVSPAWTMDPTPVLAAIERLRHVAPDRSPAVVRARLQEERAAADAELDRFVSRPLRRFARNAIAGSRAGSAGRERAKDILVQENLGVRQALHELYRRAATRGGPTDPRQCGCIAAAELVEFVRDPVAFGPVIAERLELQAYLAARRPPDWFDGHIPDPDTWPQRDALVPDAPEAGSQLSGIAVSGGVAAGPARVITDPADPRGLEPGEILVCAITDPSWTPLFLVAGAVVCDTGAIQSHAAIVARELGIPGVMSVAGATAIADGTWLEVDGDAGTISVGSAATT
ncbi:MAG TPA: PEP-utilizing enzyme [Acidimicrobiales bacterium]